MGESSHEASFKSPESQKLPKELLVFIEGLKVGLPNECDPPIDKIPEWLDLEQFQKGQQFAQKYIYGLSFSKVLAIILMFVIPTSLEPIIFTGKSSSPFTAFRRYLLTIQMINSWYEYDVWDKNSVGYRNIRTVRALHLKVKKNMDSTPPGQLKNQVTLLGKAETPVWNTVRNRVNEDFKEEYRFDVRKFIEQETNEMVQMNQLMMSTTQFGLMGLVIMHPEKFGAGKATKEELAAFVHTWRGLGYLLGVEDRFNFCVGTLEEVIQRCHYTMDFLIKPSLHIATEDWEHMMRCMAEGTSYVLPFLSFEVCLAYLYWLMGMPTSKQTALLSWTQICVFYFLKYTVNFTVKLPGMLRVYNWLLRKALDRAANFSEQQLQKLESLKYDYQMLNRSTKG